MKRLPLKEHKVFYRRDLNLCIDTVGNHNLVEAFRLLLPLDVGKPFALRIVSGHLADGRIEMDFILEFEVVAIIDEIRMHGSTGGVGTYTWEAVAVSEAPNAPLWTRVWVPQL